jgi:(p)ppGpp synthase/HD superfamily hydrolase
MNYFLVPDNAGTVDIVYDIQTDAGTVNKSVPSVHVKKNYRTNIIGNLLTQETTIEIIVDKNFNTPDKIEEI